MRFFRWLISNVLMIIVIIALIYSYVYWGNLTGTETPAGKAMVYLSDEFAFVREFIEATKRKNRQRHDETDGPDVTTAESAGETTGTSHDASQGAAAAALQQGPAVQASAPSPAPTGKAAATPPPVAAGDSRKKSGEAFTVAGHDQPATPENRDDRHPDESVTGPGDTAAKPASRAAPGHPLAETPAPQDASAQNPETARQTDRETAVPQPVEKNAGIALDDAAPVQQPATIRYQQNAILLEQEKDGRVTTLQIREARKLERMDDASGQVATVQSRQVIARSSAIRQAELEIAEAQNGFVSPQLEQELENATANGGVAALTPDSVRQVWIEARKSFYRRNYEQSEKDYRRVIAMTKNNYDAYGELGNVYFHQGKNDEATEAYYRAATILAEKGQLDRARSLLGLMHFLDREKAEQLYRLVESVSKRQDRD